MIKADNAKRYNQLAVELLKKIFNGYYKLGTRLPSTRELAKQASVNPNTMQRALQVLQDEKVLLQHYSKQIRLAALENGHINQDTEDSIKQRLITALFQFRFDEQ